MTFESMIDVNSNPNSNSTNGEEAVVVKVSFGDEMRRAPFQGGAYVALHELVAKMFGLDQAAFVLKYQDEDGDKITMSSDGEVKEALQLAKEKKLLRLFVELKPQVHKVDEAATAPPPVEMPCGGPFGFGPRFGRGPFGHGPHPHGPHGHGPHGDGPHGPHAHGPHDPHAHGPHGHHGPHRGFHGHHGFRGGFGRGGFGRGGFGMRGGFAFHGRFGPVAPPAPVPATEGSPNASLVPQSGDANANFHTPYMFAHGSFSPADGCPFPKDGNGPYAARCAFKEHKHAMKEHIRFMKMNAATPEDFEALKEFKQQMKSECKARWHAMKDAKKEAKKDKKCEKKWDKKMEKCDKHNRPWAKHVADVTIPDNSELPADTPVTKTWRLKNEGNVAWPADSHLIFVSHKGDNLNGPERVFVGSVEPQQEVDVSVTFITPSQPGRYVGYYRMASGDGDKFGQRVWVSFIIPLTTVAHDVPVTTTTTTTTATPTAGALSADIAMD